MNFLYWLFLLIAKLLFGYDYEPGKHFKIEQGFVKLYLIKKLMKGHQRLLLPLIRHFHSVNLPLTLLLQTHNVHMVTQASIVMNVV